MKQLEAALLALLVLSSAGCGSSPTESDRESQPDATATYRVVFESVWSLNTHPQDYPPSPHFSGLIGATHNSDVVFWKEGEPASQGIERMAEAGAKTPLDTEVETAIRAGSAGVLLSGGGIRPSPGDVDLTFDAALDFPHVTLVSMIAPSPDWFVGVSGLSLLEDGDWVDRKTVELYPYDAGTDGGTTYLSPENDTDPADPIFRIRGAPFATGGDVPSLGTYTFTRQ